MSTGARRIETRYAGRLFRSRLEARWAVFLDALGIPWEYEPEGYLLPSGPFLPDFHLPNLAGRRAFLEIKPFGAAVDARWSELAAASGHPVYVAFGMDMPGRCIREHGLIELHNGDGWDCCREFCLCPDCGLPGLEFNGAGHAPPTRPVQPAYANRSRDGESHRWNYAIVTNPLKRHLRRLRLRQ